VENKGKILPAACSAPSRKIIRMQTTQMTGGGARSRALRARGHDPFGYAQDKKRRGPKGPPLQGLFTESCAGERLPEEGEEAGAGAEAVVGMAGEGDTMGSGE